MELCPLYVHIPFCISKCEYCDFFSVPLKEFCNKNNKTIKDITALYVDTLIKEASYYADVYNIQNWKTIYIGGGTPSILPPDDVYKLITGLLSIRSCVNCEITVEANPEDISIEWLKTIYSAGANRLSIGIQSFHDSVLKRVKRRGSFKSTIEALDLIKKYWKGTFSVDIIAGLPGIDKDLFISDIKTVLSYNPQHISMYSLIIEEKTPLGKKCIEGFENQDNLLDLGDELWLNACDILKNSGFEQYEISNFAYKTQDNRYRSTHNLSYWNMDSYLGVGIGAVSSFSLKDLPENMFDSSKYSAIRFSHSDNIKQYVENPLHNQEIEYIDAQTYMFEHIMMGFRTLDGINCNDFFNRFHVSLHELIEPVFSQWEKTAYAHYRGNNKEFVALTDKGILFLNRFLEELL